MCAFQSASEFVELGPAYVLNNGEMHCFIPFWNRVESVTNIVIQDMVQNRTLALEMAAGSEIFIFYAVWWLDLDTQIGSVAGTFGPTLSPAIGHDPINSPMVTIHGIGFNPEDTFFVRFQGVGNDRATLTTPALTDEQAYLTSIINDTLLIFSLPSYEGPETVVSMTLFKCRAYPNCEEISKEQGLSVAHPGDAVLTTFRYVATWRSFSMPAVGDAASSYCDPYGSQKCWGVSGGGDMISVHGKGFGTLSAYRYACKFSNVLDVSQYVWSSLISTQDPDVIVCETPVWPYYRGLTSVEIFAKDLQQIMPRFYSQNATLFIFDTWVHSVFPSAGPWSGLTVTVRGNGFENAANQYTCHFDGEHHVAVHAVFVTSMIMTCETGEWATNFPSGDTVLYVSAMTSQRLLASILTLRQYPLISRALQQ